MRIGLLNRQSKEVLDLAVIEQYLESNSDLERICSAISLTNTPISNLVLKTLVDGILNGQKLEHNNLIRFNEGSLSGYASISLSHYGKNEKDYIIPVLCKKLESVNPYESLDITSSILELLNDNRKIPIRDEKLSNLDSVEKMTLEYIYNYGGWSINGGDFINFIDLLRSAGFQKPKLSWSAI